MSICYSFILLLKIGPKFVLDLKYGTYKENKESNKKTRRTPKDRKPNCDTPIPGCPLTTRQPAENLYVSYHETHT